MAEQVVELQPGEAKIVSFEAIPREARVYQVSVDGLTGSFEAVLAPPTGKIVSMTWDSPPPFTAGEEHTLTIEISWEGLYYYWANIYDNEMWVGNATAYYGEPKEILTWDYAFTPGSHEIRVKLWCHPEVGPDVKVDEKTLNITVKEVPPPPGVIDGELLVGEAWYENSWHGFWNTNWPADTEILFWFLLENTGDRSATFTVSFMGKSSQAYIRPGERGNCSFKSNAIAGTHSLNVYGDSKLVDSYTIGVTTYEVLGAGLGPPKDPSPLPPYPRRLLKRR